jgi:hypothetical protein
MAQRFRIFLVVWLLIFAGKFFGQNIPQQIYSGINSQEILTRFKIKPPIYEAIKNQPAFTLAANSCNEKNIVNNPKIILYPYYLKGSSVISEGVLCRAEYKFQKVTSIPLRLRLGSLEYTNYLEQKPNALKPN